MRNFRIVQDQLKRFDSDLPITASVWDPSSDLIIFTLGPAPSQQVIELRRLSTNVGGAEATSELIASWEAPCPLPGLVCDEVLNLHYFADTEKSCLVLAGGDIYTVLHSPISGEEKIQIVGSVDEGIKAAAWSPDDELLVLATGADTVLFMTVDFDQTASVELHEDDTKLSKHVSVGWGKVETQFKGKRARVLHDPTMPETVEDGVLSSHDCGETTISWRGDGAYLAMNSIVATGPRRMIRVYTRDGVLDSVSEPINGLEGALSWRPAGNLIAGVQRLDKDVNVVFFERNGLRHGKFSLRLSDEDTRTWASQIRLTWNVDSSALAVALKGRVQVWTMSNYHYFLKQELLDEAETASATLSSISWHPEDPLRLSVFPQATSETKLETSLRLVSMLSTISGGSHMPPYDYGTVAVIDGRRLKITPIRKANIPPPMAAHEIDLAENIKDVAVNKSGSGIAVLHEHTITVIDVAPKDLSQSPRIRQTFELPRCSEPTTNIQVAFVGDDHMFRLSSGSDQAELCLVTPERAETRHTFDSTFPISTFASLDHQSICVSCGMSLHELTTDTKSSQLSMTEIKMPSSTLHAQVIKVGDETIVVGLSKLGALFANNRQLVKGCTSFLLTSSHIIFTTSNHLLKFIHLTSVSDLEVPPDAPETDERCRSVERGARLVTVMPTTYSLTLQMPRGNLETIFPRALVLASIRRNIDGLHYGKAFRTCRTQRVDMNILHDYAPEQFLANIRLFVEQLSTVEYIDLFLSSLNDSDVSKTLYLETLPKHRANGNSGTKDQAETSSSKSEGKVNRICEAFLEVLKDKYETNLQNVITANVSMVPPNIEAGLKVVMSLHNKDEVQAELALQHMCFLVDVNQVYDRALGLYDLNLALLVAQQSQKDPREYIPYLQRLQEMHELRRKFSIDNDLKRYAKAMAHLRSLNAFDEVKVYVQNHELYKEALELYRYEAELWRELLRLHADFLVSRNRYRDAGIAYESINDLPSALSAYRGASLWRQALPVAMRIPLPEPELNALAKDLVESLIESKSYIAAATIALDHLRDVEAAVEYLCKGFQPTEAIRVATVRQRADLIPKTIDDGIREAAASLTKLMADCKSQILAQTARLAEVRAIKARDPLHYLTGESSQRAQDRDFPDDVSLAPTESSLSPSLFTRYGGGASLASGTLATDVTRRTSKNRRREERKRARGKKGSVYEEEYLLNSLERLVARVNESHADVAEVVEACARRSMWELAKAVEGAVVEVVALLEERMRDVFGGVEAVAPGAVGPLQDDAGLDEQRPMGGDGVLWDSIEGMAKREAPVLKKFERSGLLS